MILKIAHKRTLGALNRNSDATDQFLEQKKKRTQIMSSRGPTGGLFMSIFRFLWILENFVILLSPELKNSEVF